MEVWYPIYRLREAGCKVALVGPDGGASYASKLGYPAKSDKAARDCTPDEFDAMVISRRFSRPDFLVRRHRSRPQAGALHIAEQGKPVAAICHGPWVLCSTTASAAAKKATCFFAIKDDVVNAGRQLH